MKGKGRASGGRHRESERVSFIIFFFVLCFFLNIVLTWKFVGASKTSVIYIYIYWLFLVLWAFTWLALTSIWKGSYNSAFYVNLLAPSPPPLRVGMAILSCPAWPTPSCFVSYGFFLPCKGGGAGMERDFRPAPRDEARMGLHFLDPSYPTPPYINEG